MSILARLVAFAAGLAVAFGSAALAGAAIDPTDARSDEAPGAHGASGEHRESAPSDAGANGPAEPAGDPHAATARRPPPAALPT